MIRKEIEIVKERMSLLKIEQQTSTTIVKDLQSKLQAAQLYLAQIKDTRSTLANTLYNLQLRDIEE